MNFSWLFIGSRDTPTHLHAGLGEIGGERGEVLRFAGAARRVVLRVEIEHQRLPGRSQVDAAAVARGRGDRRCLVAFADHLIASCLMLFHSSAIALPRRVVLGKQLVPARRAARLGDQLPGLGGRLDVPGRDQPHHHQHARKQL